MVSPSSLFHLLHLRSWQLARHRLHLHQRPCSSRDAIRRALSLATGCPRQNCRWGRLRATRRLRECHVGDHSQAGEGSAPPSRLRALVNVVDPRTRVRRLSFCSRATHMPLCTRSDRRPCGGDRSAGSSSTTTTSTACSCRSAGSSRSSPFSARSSSPEQMPCDEFSHVTVFP